MIVHVHNQEQVCALAPIAGTAVISICNPGYTAPLLEGWDAVLRMKFHGQHTLPKDDPPRGSFPGKKAPRIVLFDESMAREIDGFCHANHDKDFVVHCKGGLHRSVAVGVYLQEVFGAEMFLHAAEAALYEDNLVYQLLMRPYKGMDLCK